MKFTKGPWSLCDKVSTLVTSGNRSIASTGCYQTNVDFDKTHDENIANAHLIAAAPELYQALENILCWREQRDTPYVPIDYIEGVASLALAKARGES